MEVNALSRIYESIKIILCFLAYRASYQNIRKDCLENLLSCYVTYEYNNSITPTPLQFPHYAGIYFKCGNIVLSWRQCLGADARARYVNTNRRTFEFQKHNRRRDVVSGDDSGTRANFVCGITLFHKTALKFLLTCI
jgi:hypothetical protein